MIPSMLQSQQPPVSLPLLSFGVRCAAPCSMCTMRRFVAVGARVAR
jgi:hypothetical protein